jgi:OOP family OmpA-OmpF porin
MGVNYFLRILAPLAVVALLLGVRVASADDFYVYPAAYYSISDPSKNAGNNYGFQLSLGYDFWDHFSAEVVSESPNYKSTSASGDLKSHGASADARYRFLDGPLQPFVLVGGGWMRTSDDLGGYGSYLALAGLGIEWALPKWNLGVRADALVRHEFVSNSTVEKSNLNDEVTSLGVTYHFGGSRATEPAHETSAVRYAPPTAMPPARAGAEGTPQAGVMSAKPSSGLPDSDGDGVDDAHDRCPDTPPTATVDSDGCITGIKH